jgi:hypothetical protein
MNQDRDLSLFSLSSLRKENIAAGRSCTVCSVQKLVGYLDLVPDVDDERVADGLHGGPLVGEEDGEHAGVGVRGEAQREARPLSAMACTRTTGSGHSPMQLAIGTPDQVPIQQ